MARDLYCKSELGATIIRLKSFGKYNERKNNAEIKLLEKTIRSLQNNNNYYTYDYDKFLLGNWKNTYNNELSFITWVEENYTKDIYNPNIENLIVTCNYSIYSIINQFLHNINDLSRLFFNKRIIINFI